MKRLTDRELIAIRDNVDTETHAARDAIAYRRALTKIVELTNEYGNGVTLDMVVTVVGRVARRALGRTK